MSGAMSGAASLAAERGPSTTSGTIAVVNLHAQIDGLASASVLLVELLLLRGQVLGRIADYERAVDLAARLVRDTPGDGSAWLARARTRAAFHRFTEALADLEMADLEMADLEMADLEMADLEMADLELAERTGLARAAVARDRAVILQAIGCHYQARDLYRSAAKDQPGLATLGALAVFHAERGEVAEAERLFAEARGQHRGTSPFLLASLDYRRGLMWYRQGELGAARTWFDASQRRVPAYVPALGHLAAIDAAQGAHEAAIDRLRPLASASDDPQYAAQFARALNAAGHHREAETWHASAAARYDDLARRHPQGYAGHAADFRRQPSSLRPSG
jgi:tetratricopeptide (TPR) repeat protein